ncbi:YheC/YheD family protein [Ammoniphilus resinae]|uniref:Glutathione synthase/RimK-type ligase-like ATP-grasp enzyme n=1 Tax=Ammoniphilus resinae TaxID=861532 RepID=A0ABS4GU42_9BACL|nr:glutathione synthase/RimK-type ligase-like ATP-grasp enzyme [Ammoniphilus resinae]
MYQQRKYQYVASKWTKTHLLMQDDQVKARIPDTRPLTYENLTDMLSLYSVLYLKPDNGMKGQGIIRLTHVEDSYLFHTREAQWEFLTFEDMLPILKQLTKNYKFVIQQGVSLLTYQEHPIDFRVLLQKPKDKWVYSGIVGKMGEKNSIVTNMALGGKGVSFKTALTQTLQMEEEEIKSLRDAIRDLCFRIADQLTSKYHGLRELGIDLVIDPNREVWILEVNTTPGHQLFRSLPNEKIYQRIVRNVRLINEQY